VSQKQKLINYREITREYATNFNIFRRFLMSESPYIAFLFLKEGLDKLSKYIEDMKKANSKIIDHPKIINLRAHRAFGIALTSNFYQGNKEAGLFYEEALKLFKKAGNDYNANILEKELLDPDTGLIHIPFLDDNLNFELRKDSKENNNHSNNSDTNKHVYVI